MKGIFFSLQMSDDYIYSNGIAIDTVTCLPNALSAMYCCPDDFILMVLIPWQNNKNIILYC